MFASAYSLTRRTGTFRGYSLGSMCFSKKALARRQSSSSDFHLSCMQRCSVLMLRVTEKNASHLGMHLDMKMQTCSASMIMNACRNNTINATMRMHQCEYNTLLCLSATLCVSLCCVFHRAMCFAFAVCFIALCVFHRAFCAS
jgi:hypothetical protein